MALKAMFTLQKVSQFFMVVILLVILVSAQKNCGALAGDCSVIFFKLVAILQALKCYKFLTIFFFSVIAVNLDPHVPNPGNNSMYSPGFDSIENATKILLEDLKFNY